MPFKINDYVKITQGFIPKELDQPVYGWQGRIKEIPKSPGDGYLVAFDALTLDTLPDEYLAACIEDGEKPFEYYFPEEDLELATRRDNDALLKAAVNKIKSRMAELDNEAYKEREFDQALMDKWMEAFVESKEFESLTEDSKVFAADAPDMFAQYAFNYEGAKLGKWSVSDVEQVCLDWVPRKVSAEIEYFEHFGEGLAAFFSFLYREKLMKGADKLAKTATKIAPKIAKVAADPSNWGMAKSLVMMAHGAGVDPTDERQMKGFIGAYNMDRAKNLPSPAPKPKHEPREKPAQPDPYRNIGRNDAVKVKYSDGTVKETKFKKVERELREGICSLLK